MYPASPSAYDRAITVFSPEGRLFQVEYAREAVKRGTTALGIVFKDGVLLAIDKNITSKLLKAESLEKIFKIDEHIAVATSGLVADARRLIDYARVTAQEERLVYNAPIDVEVLTKELCDLKQSYTQWGGVRPFGASLLIVGVDDTGKHLFETDPSGAFHELLATAIGSGKEEVEKFFEKEYSESLDFEEAVMLALRALTKVGDRKISKETVDVCFIKAEDRKFKRMEKNEIEKFIAKVHSKRK